MIFISFWLDKNVPGKCKSVHITYHLTKILDNYTPETLDISIPNYITILNPPNP